MAHFCDRVMYVAVLHSHLEVVTWYGDCSTDIGGPAGSTKVAESINEESVVCIQGGMKRYIDER